MKQIVHRSAAVIATLCIATFFSATLVSELFGSYTLVASVKQLIVSSGLFILIPAIAITAASGFSLSAGRKGGLIDKKRKRMPIIAANGILILLPAAIYLNQLASSGSFNNIFYLVQIAELIAGGTNLVLMSLNIRDELKLSGRFRQARKST